VVRPCAGRPGRRAGALLRQHGHAPLCCRCWKPWRQRTHRLPELLPQADIVIAVSMHAVHFTHHFLLQTGQTWPHIDYFAVGQASADAFAEVGIQALSPDDPRSEGLLALPACKG
jgi:uroporphyrinogen-III synthase